MRLPFVLSVPHAGVSIPGEARPYCVLTDAEVVRDGDEGAAETYALEDEVEAFLTTDVARAVVDLNRAEDDRRPDGMIKTETCWGVRIYDPPLPDDVAEQLVERYYRPYHARLRELSESGAVLAVDCHTMAAVGPPIGPMAGEERPKICLSSVGGTSCPPELFRVVAGGLAEAFGFEPSIDFPFRGGFITRRYGSLMAWVQLELSRAAFITLAEKRERVREALRIIARRLA